MNFSRAQLSQAAFGRDANWQISSNGYRAHELVWKLFSDRPDRERDFLFRWETENPTRTALPVLYTVSERPPCDSEGLFARLQSKTYDPQITVGDRFAFQLRANPVVKRRDDKGRQQVHDVVMDAKQRDEEERYTQAELVQTECYRWLADGRDARPSRAERAGFTVSQDRFIAESYERHEFKKSSGDRRIVIVTADLRGILEVTNVERFRAALFGGVGPSKAFGCGLLMIRRA